MGSRRLAVALGLVALLGLWSSVDAASLSCSLTFYELGNLQGLNYTESFTFNSWTVVEGVVQPPPATLVKSNKAFDHPSVTSVWWPPKGPDDRISSLRITCSCDTAPCYDYSKWLTVRLYRAYFRKDNGGDYAEFQFTNETAQCTISTCILEAPTLPSGLDNSASSYAALINFYEFEPANAIPAPPGRVPPPRPPKSPPMPPRPPTPPTRPPSPPRTRTPGYGGGNYGGNYGGHK